MSPRSTHTLHDGCYVQHLLAVHLIGFERGNLVRERLALLQPRGTVDDCAANRLRPAQPGRLKLVQRPERFVVQAQADRDRHSRNVSRNVIHAFVSFRGAGFADLISEAVVRSRSAQDQREAGPPEGSLRLVFWPNLDAKAGCAEDQLRVDADSRFADPQGRPLTDEFERAAGRQRPGPPPQLAVVRTSAAASWPQERPGWFGVSVWPLADDRAAIGELQAHFERGGKAGTPFDSVVQRGTQE